MTLSCALAILRIGSAMPLESGKDADAARGVTGTPSGGHGVPAWPRIAVAVVAVGGAVAVTLSRWPGDETSVALQGACLLAAAVAVVAIGGRTPRGPLRLRRRALVGGLLLLVVAGALRLAAQTVLPPPDQTAFEEIQMGGAAYRLLGNGVLALQFRFTTLTAAAGLAVGGSNLASLRAPFKLAGLLVLLFLLLTLRRLKVSWPVTALVVVVAATLRWFVIAAGCADEMFAPMLWVGATMWLLVGAQGDGQPSLAAAGVLGILSGVLMYEHPAYLPVLALAGGWLVWRAAVGQVREGASARAWAAPALFLAVLFTTACPLLSDLVHQRFDSAVFEPFRRHVALRGAWWAEGSVPRAWHYLVALGGGPVRGDEGLAVVGTPALPPPFGALLVAAGLAGFWVGRRPQLRGMLATVIGGILIASAVAANINVARLSGLLLIMLVPFGCVVDDALGWVARRITSPERTGGGGRAFRVGAAGTLAVALVALNLASVRALAADPRGREMYTQDEYAVSVFIARAAHPGQTVVLWTPDVSHGWAPAEQTEMIWLLHPKRLRILGVTSLPAADAVAPGTLVVAGVQGRALTENEFGVLEQLAEASGSRDTLTSAMNLAGARSVAGFCVRYP